MLIPRIGGEDFPESGEEEEVNCFEKMLAEWAIQLDQLLISKIGNYEQK